MYVDSYWMHTKKSVINDPSWKTWDHSIYNSSEKREELGDYISSNCVSEEHECLGQKWDVAVLTQYFYRFDNYHLYREFL